VEHLFSIVASAIATSMQKKLRDLDVWKAPFEEVQTELNSGIGVCERWCEASSELTNIWKEGTDVRLWEGVDYHDKYVLSLSCRFKKVLDLRRTCKEIHRLQMDQMDTGLEPSGRGNAERSLIEHFAGMKTVFYNLNTDSAWSADRVQNVLKMCHGEERCVGP